MRKQLLVSTAVLALSAGAAFASDLPTHKSPPPPAPAPVAAFTWTGCYVGLHAGGDFGHSKWTDEFGNTLGMNTAGAIGGGQIGCNYEVNNFVVGAEGELWGSGLAGSTSRTIDGEGVYTDTYKTRSDFAGDIAVRAGYAIDRTLIFGKVGVAMADYKYTIDYSATGERDTANATHTGLLLGLGLEYALDAHWSVKGEYDYIDYGSKSANFKYAGVTDFSASFKNEENILKVGVNYRF